MYEEVTIYHETGIYYTLYLNWYIDKTGQLMQDNRTLKRSDTPINSIILDPCIEENKNVLY